MLLASAFLPLSTQAAQPADFSALKQPEQIRIAQVIDPLRLRLANGTIVQLAGIDIPDLDPYESGPLAAGALAALKPLLENKQARLYRTGDPKKGRVNRMGYELGHVAVDRAADDGTVTPVWIQGHLIAEGFARARPDAANPEMRDAMTALEDTARTGKKGLWADPLYAVRSPETAGELTGRFGIVEGKIHAAAMNNNIVFLNFGPDWKTDFTIGLESGVRRALTRGNLDPLQFVGRTVRIRGWVEDYNGPFIRLDDLSKLEFTDAPATQETPHDLPDN